MRQTSPYSAFAIFLAASAATLGDARPAPEARFLSPQVVTATDISYPINTATPGIVTFLLRLDDTARIQNVQVLRDVSPLTQAAKSAIQSWTFAPASRDGNPVPARLSINVVFNPFNPGGVAIEVLKVPLPPTPPGPNDSDFNPPQITSGSFAVYPVNSIASGTVVLDATIDKKGGVTKVQVVRALPSLTSQSIKAVKSWGFTPATHKGQPVVSHIVVAFVFPSPAAANPA
jgi:TonB family protein